MYYLKTYNVTYDDISSRQYLYLLMHVRIYLQHYIFNVPYSVFSQMEFMSLFEEGTDTALV